MKKKNMDIVSNSESKTIPASDQIYVLRSRPRSLITEIINKYQVMNRIFYYTILSSFILFSCVKEDYLKYDTTQKDGVYLNYTPETDSVFFNFGFDSKTEHIIELNCMVMGVPKDYDRTISLKAVNDKYSDEVLFLQKLSTIVCLLRLYFQKTAFMSVFQ